MQGGNQSEVKENCALSSEFDTHLADGFEKRKRLDITYGASDLYKADIMPLSCCNNRFFDFVGDVGDYLNGTPESPPDAPCG